MTAPHVHTCEEAKSAIKRIEHNQEGSYGKPTSIEGGSGGNFTSGSSESVPPHTKGADWANKSKD